MTFSDALLDRLGALPPGQVLLLAAALLAAEVGLLVGVAVPAASTMLTVGLLARAGTLDLGAALAVTTLAAFAGDQLGYWEGRLLGPRLRDGRIGRWIGPARWDRAESLIARRGGAAVLVGRWTAFARTLVPRVAGMAGLPYRRFVAFDAAAVAVWVPGTVLIGWAAGGVPAGLPLAAGLLLAAGVAVTVGTRRVRARRRPAGRPCRGPVRRGRSPVGPVPGSRRPGAGRTAPARRGVPHHC
ncbi:DedA family protein [Micromonospora mirobrigensis]|uniref:Membrane protein DedA, SNARE-associated domain n=1 Tax=Micromonospora mirobrigensis TaxID=262898 RepID=A0A1C4XMT0_9ACTN|nr:DedA family protein [Micromonospora mirobrigensis]SCF09849.1 membrane protein DedA, SNARE-associated domain [Micromonospora mirobrigensis]